MSERPREPLIFIIDIDGTMIGDIKPQVMMYEMNIALKRVDKKINVFNVKEFQNKLRSGIIRPYFSKFIKKITLYSKEYSRLKCLNINWKKYCLQI